MLVAFVGVSCVGKSTITNLLNETGYFIYLKNIITRPSRPGELHKITYTDIDFDTMLKNGDIALQNKHFGFQYGYLKKEVDRAIVDLDNFYMIEFGIENINTLFNLPNTFVIILIPESKDFLLTTVQKIRNERFEQIKHIFEEHYEVLTEESVLHENAFVVRNKINQQGTVAFKILSYLKQKIKLNDVASIFVKKSRLHFIIENIKSCRAASNGLEAYKLLTECIDNFEDIFWGRDYYNPPRSFLGGVATDRIYTILPESFYQIPNYSGVTLLVSVTEIVFISRFGALEGQLKDVNDVYGLVIPFEKRKDKILFSKNDAFGDSVWHSKNY